MSYVPTMPMMGAAAYAAAVANAVKACGTLVRVDGKVFLKILSLQEEPLVVMSSGGFFSTTYCYITSYKGLAFYYKGKIELTLPNDIELITADKISIPTL